MSALERARDRFAAPFEAFQRGLGAEPGWLASLRRASLAHFAEQGLPTTRWEDWRYTSLAPLANERFELAARETPRPEWDEALAGAAPKFACSEYVFAGGRFEPSVSTPGALTGDVHVASLARMLRESPERLEARLGRLVDAKAHPFAALNTAYFGDGAVLFAPENARSAQPMHVVFAAVPGRVQHPRVLIVAAPGSRVVLIQDHVSLGDGASFTNALTEVHVGPGAHVEWVLVQRENASGFHTSGLHVRLERDARFEAHTLSLGGRLVRNDVRAELAGEGAECSLQGLFVGDGEQLLDNHTTVDHAVPHGTSRELYKGILRGSARGVFRGRVIVRPDAQQTSADQQNPNLLLSDAARVNTRPQLEIHADDVKCSHGSSIGQIDPDALFYLRSRGIGEPAARALLTRGFAAEVLRALPVAALGEALAERLDAGALAEEGA